MARFWDWLFGAPAAPIAIASPYASQGALSTFISTDILDTLKEQDVLTRDLAMRVAPLRRAHNIFISMLGPLPLRDYDNATLAPEQPAWLSNTASGIAPYNRMAGIVSDLFWTGWAALGCELGPDGLPVDAIHVPTGFWSTDPQTGELKIDDRIPAKYRQHIVAIPLGTNGLLVDAADTINASRAIERAWVERVENPLPQTDLHITDPAYNELTREEKFKIVDDWNTARKRAGGQTAVTPAYLDAKSLGQVAADLFESGRNAIRLDLANLADVPAALIEGSKGASGGDIRYSNETTARNELWDFGAARYAAAIEGRLSLDDVCPPGHSIRFDRSGLMSVPTPATAPATED